MSRGTVRDLARDRLVLTVLACAIALVGLVLARDTAAYSVPGLTGLWLLLSVALPLVFVGWRPGPWSIALALVIAIAPMANTTAGNMRETDHPFLRTHDGGVVATRAAAEHLLHGENPYGVDFTSDLQPDHADLTERGVLIQANPLREHYPYLPATFLANAPFVAAADAVGLTWDPRLLYELTVVLVLAVVAAGRRPPWVRAATIVAVGNAFVATYAGWGTNDAAAAALVVLAGLLVARRPQWAAVALAVAISLKLFLVVAVLPFGVLVLRRGGASALRRWWPLPMVLIVTCIPFFVVGPRAFLDDVLSFNLGKSRLHYPTSGLGLPATHPDVFHGALLAATVVALFAAGAVIAVALVRWLPTGPACVVATAVLIGAVLLPNRTFQATYLTDLTVLAGAGWLLVADDGRHEEPAVAGSDGAALAAP